MDAIITRLDQQGPIDLHVSEEEYVWLQGRAKNLWQHADYWSQRDQKLFLAFLRGYTFYREVSENENQFWATFHDDFRIAQALPTKMQYDALWTALRGHPLTAPHCQITQSESRSRRHFVRAIDAIWGIRSLSARQLMNFFDGYYNSFPGQRIDAALMRRLLPDADEATLRQAAAYDRLFRRMVQIVDFILETDPALANLPPDALTRHLLEHGIEVGSPNPILYFANTTESGLARIVGVAGQGTRHRYRFEALRTQVRSPHPYAQAHLAPGYGIEGQPIVVQLQERLGSARQEVEIRLSEGRCARVLQGTATFTGLSQGSYIGKLYVNGREAGRSIEFTVLPEMTWVLSHRDGPLVEGQWQVGTVTLNDGRFGKFRWRPRWEMTDTGFVAGSERVLVTLDDDLQVELDVSAQSYAARIISPDRQQMVEQLSSLESLERLLVRPLHPKKASLPAVRVCWGSAPEAACDVASGRHLQDLARLSPAHCDDLIVEMKYDTVWHRVHCIPVNILPTLENVVCEANSVRLLICGAGQVEIHIREETELQVCTQSHVAKSGAQISFPLQLHDLWAPRTVTVQLKVAGNVVDERQLRYVPHLNVQGQLRDLLVQGLGWARLSSVKLKPS